MGQSAESQLKAHVQNNTNLPENIHEEVEKFGTNRWQNFLYNPVVIVTYKLDPRYRNSWLNVRIFSPIIEKKILSLVGEEYKDIVLTEFAEYVGKIGSFAHSYLWEIKIVYMFWNLQILRSLEKPLTIEGWVEKVLQKKAIREAAKGNNEQEIDVESDFSDLDFQSYSDLEGLLDEELNEFQD
ncbi:hypothetical protein RhiirA1_465633 [Rhizophagus irregularis]|uniref:Uncharacterized protein n=1 Tax=Rhizophagus irregularis TaxID=588596 RepID=A0A2N0QV77_9GLOM|nr:hypothetical protein RhiirA1_476396 [Rhizophagus irregularis]PKC62094.1 hypothetical protein RhiirA1_465633 [Rhizophagus irregularis]